MGKAVRLRWLWAGLLVCSLAGCSYMSGDQPASKQPPVQAEGGAFQVRLSQPLEDERWLPQAQAALEKKAVAQLQHNFMTQVLEPERARLEATLSPYEKRLLAKMKWGVPPLKAIQLPTFMPKVVYKDDTLQVIKEVDRAALAKVLAERIATLDRALLAYRFVPDTQPRLVQIQYLLPAYPLLLDRALYQRLLQRLPIDYTRRKQDVYAESLLGKLQTLMRKFAVAVRANIDKDATFESGLRALLVEQGLNLQGMPDVFMLYDVQAQVQPQGGQFEALFSGQMRLADASEVPFDQFSFQVRKQSETAQLARAKAVRAVGMTLLNHLDNLLLKRYYVLQGVYQK